MKYEFLEHTADQYIRAFGKTLEEAFENAGLALFDTLTDITQLGNTETEFIVVEEEDLEALLYSFIEELLVKWELTGILFSEIEVGILRKKSKFLLNAHLKGEKFDPDKHEQRVGVKAMTYCLMNIEDTPPKVRVEFVIDI